MKNYLSFDDVLLTPKFSTITSRKDVDPTTKIGTTEFRVPVISSNMDTVTNSVMAKAMREAGGISCLHRFYSIEDNVKEYLASPKDTWVSIGIGDNEFSRAHKLYDAGARTFLIDVAHGASQSVVQQTVNIKTFFPDVSLIVGNFATAEAINEFKKHIGDIKIAAYKVGIGGGCFGAGTRILMSNGTYKNIEDITIGDRVINKNGVSVTVVGTQNSGIKNVIEYKNNTFYKSSFATPDHKHWVGDYSTTKDINDHSLVKTLDKLTKKDESKYKWKRLDETNKSVMLLPKNIKFELNEDFLFNFKDYYVHDANFEKTNVNNEIKSKYELGYLFGTFLGDGNSHLTNYNNSTRGQVSWYFGLSERSIAEKVVTCLKEVFNISASIEQKENMQLVHAYSMPLAKLFDEFGKKEKKQLPNKYISSNNNYNKGLYDGLIDSDGHIALDGRFGLQNTSPYIIELFGFLNYCIFGYYPSMAERFPTIGGLTNCDLENCKPSFTARGVKNSDNYLTNDYQISRINSYKEHPIEIETYDIEVDCETHSFIANNVIVHNSACLTRKVTGCGIPTFGSVMDCATTGEVIIADGGCRDSGDICKALAAGASAVMLGGMLAGAEESPSNYSKTITTSNNEEISVNDLYKDMSDKDILKEYIALGKYNNPPFYPKTINKYKKYRGSASLESYEVQGKVASHRSPEGDSFYVPYTGPVANTMQQIEGGIRSCMSYLNATKLKEMQENAEFLKVTSAGALESSAHGKK